MTKILASSKLDKFNLNGELDELTPQVKNGLYKKFNFEGTVNTYVNLKESKILVLQRYEGGDIKILLEPKSKITYKDIRGDVNFFKNMSLDYAKQFDLIVFDGHVWSVPLEDLQKSIDLTNNGIPCLLVGNDTSNGFYGLESRTLSITENSDLARSYIQKENIPIGLNNYIFSNKYDDVNFPSKLASDKVFPILKCKNYYPMIAYESPCNTISICDFTAALAYNKDFFFKIIEWLISTKHCIKYNQSFLFGDGIVCQDTYNNLWKRYPNNEKFSKCIKSGDWSMLTNSNLKDNIQFNDNPRIIKCSPKKGMNYYTISSVDYKSEYSDSEYPAGTKYKLSCWAYVEEDCDMVSKYVRIMGEHVTDGGPEGYDFNKKGTWQYLSGTIVSNAPGFYFLLYANVGYEQRWTKGNVYFANVVISKTEKEEEFRYIDFEKSNEDSYITLENLSNSDEFTMIYEYEQLITYIGKYNDFHNLTVLSMYPKDASKPLSIYDYYYPSHLEEGKCASWVAFDNYVASSEWFWHLHQGFESFRKKGDKAYIVVIKTREDLKWHIVKNNVVFNSQIAPLGKYPDLVNFSLDKISISNGHGGLVKSISVYNRALQFDEIKKTTKNEKYMSISLDGNLNTNNLSEQPWIPEDCFYMSLAKDNCKNYMRIEDEMTYEDDWSYVGNNKNYLGKNILIPSSDLVTCIYDENENEYTVHVPKDDSMLWYEKAVKINWVKVEGDERYVMAFDFYCDKDMYIGIDLNNTTNGIESNDNHENTVTNVHEKQIGGKYNHLYIMYDLMNNSPIFSCWNAIYVSTAETIPPEGITFKIKNIRLHKIKGGKKNNFKNIYYPCNNENSNSKHLKFNLHEDIGLEWNKPWTICYTKKPISTYINSSGSSDERSDYLIDSIGCNENSVGHGYFWFGKKSGYRYITISGGSTSNFNDEDFYYKQQLWVIKFEKTKITFSIYFENGKKLDSIISQNIDAPNRFVTQYGYDLLLGGWDNWAICQAFYKDLIVAQRCLTDKELEKIFKARIIDKPNNTNISNLLIEGGI